MKDKIIRKVLPNFKEFDKKAGTYLVGLSGGPDSVALLHIIVALGYQVAAVHIHHGLRKESDEELNFCKKISEKLNIKFYSTKLEFNKDEGKNQEIYRKKRYEFYEEIYKKEGAKGIFLGHHLDDQIENIVTAFFKRKSVMSLSGMEGVSEVLGMVVIRPLLTVRKREILEFLTRHGLDSRVDKSNFEAIYERNKVRLEFLPFAEKIFGESIFKTLKEVSENAASLKESQRFYATKLREKYAKTNKIDLNCLEEHSMEILIAVIDEEIKLIGESVDKSFLKEVKKVLLNKNEGIVENKNVYIKISKKEIMIINKK